MAFDADTLAWMRATQIRHMPDICRRRVYVSTQDDYGQEIPSWIEDATDIPCGLELQPGNEVVDPRMTTIHWDATIRLPVATDINPQDRVSIQSRFGENLVVPLIFQVVGPPQRGPSAMRLKLLKVDAQAEDVASV